MEAGRLTDMLKVRCVSWLLVLGMCMEILRIGANKSFEISPETTEITSGDIHVEATNSASRVVSYKERDILVCPSFSCVGRCSLPPENVTMAKCFCDEVCSFYGDCCFDVHEICGPHSTLSTEQLERLANQEPHCSNLIQDEFAFLIDQCAENWSRDTTRQRCENERSPSDEDIFLILAVTAKDLNIAYKSIYCALCNNVDPENVELWQIKINFPFGEGMSALDKAEVTLTQIRHLIESDCHLSMRPRDEKLAKRVRYCNSNYVNICHSGAPAIELSHYTMNTLNTPADTLSRVCSEYTAYVIAESSNSTRHILKNTHCAICLNDSIEATDLSCPDPRELLFDFHVSRIIFGLPPFSLILDFNGYHWQPTWGTNEAGIAQCSNESFYINGDCREGRCKENFHKEGDKCLSNFHAEDRSLVISFSVNLRENSMNSAETFLSEEAMEHGVVLANVTSDLHQDDLLVDCGGVLSLSVVQTTVFDYDLQISSENISLFDVLQYIDDLVLDGPSFPLLNMKINNLGAFLDFSESICDNSLEKLSLETNETNKDVVFITEEGIRYKPDELLYEISWCNRCDGELIQATTEKNITGCPLPEADCLFVQVSEEELAQVKSALLAGSLNYTENEVAEIDGLTHVCGEVFKGGLQLDDLTFRIQEDIVERIMTAVLLSISISFLLCTVLTYCFVPRLRSVPGKVVLSLSVVLLLAQVLFLAVDAATEIPWLCEVVAAVEHYLWLSSFAWSNVLSLDLEITLTASVKVGKNRDNSRSLILYSLYSWGVPAVVVSLVLLISHLTTLPVTYGNERICWLMYGDALLVSFALPVGLAVIVNCGLLSRAVFYIWKVSKLVKNANVIQDQKSQAFLYAKLLFLMGFTWIFGFFGTLLQNKPLMYIFTIFNSLQGVYIFIAFMANKRVWGFYGKLVLYRISNRFFSSTRLTSTTSESIGTSR